MHAKLSFEAKAACQLATERISCYTRALLHDSLSTFAFIIKTTAAMELPGGIEKDELGVALSYAIMLGGAPSAPNGAAKSTPAVQPAPGQSKKAAKKEAKAKAKADKKAAAPAAAPKKAAPAKPAPAAEEDDDDDFWGEDEEQTEEEKAAAAKELEEAKAKAMAKLAKKEANQRSLCNLEIKPWEADQDLKALYAKIKKTVVKDGLKWSEGLKLVDVAFGVQKIICTAVVNQTLSMDAIIEEITEELFTDEVQSMSMTSMSLL